MSNDLIRAPLPQGVQVQFTDAAHERADLAVQACDLIVAVSDADSNALAVSAQRQVHDLISEVEKARKAAKQPVLELGRAIDGACEAFVSPLKKAELKVATLIGDFQQEQLEKQRAEQRRIAEEQARIERERIAEEARIQAEQEAAARAAREKLEAELRAAKDAKAAEEAKERAARAEAEAAAKAEADRKRAEEQAAFAAECIRPPVVEAVRAEGQAVRTDWEIVSLNEWVLAKARPDLVRRIEFDTLGIKEELKRGVKLPGVTAREVVKSVTRSGRKEIEV